MIIPEQSKKISCHMHFKGCWLASVQNLVKLWEFTVIEKDHLGDWSPEKDCC